MYFGFGGNVLRILQTSMKLYADHLHNLIKPSERVAGWIHRCETPQCSPLTQQISRLRQGTSALSDDGDMMPHATSRKEATNAVLHERLQVAYYCADTESFSRRCLPIRGLFSIRSQGSYTLPAGSVLPVDTYRMKLVVTEKWCEGDVGQLRSVETRVAVPSIL